MNVCCYRARAPGRRDKLHTAYQPEKQGNLLELDGLAAPRL